jgi:hypothetical protein
MRFWNARLHLADPTQHKMRVLLDENLSTARRSPPLSTDLLYLIVDSCFRGNGPMVGPRHARSPRTRSRSNGTVTKALRAH